MKYSHFVVFAAEMIKESMEVLETEGFDKDDSEVAVIKALTNNMQYLADKDEEEICDVALDMGMYEFIEGWADNCNAGEPLYEIASLYVTEC